MRRSLRMFLMTACLLALPVAAMAQSYTYTIGGLVGVGGSLDETDAGFGQPAWQLTFTSDIADKTYFAARLGGLHWGGDDQVAEMFGPALYYAVLAGEYKETRASFSGGFIEPGVYIGLGFYSLQGEDELGESLSENAPGLAIGITGDIPLNGKRTIVLRTELAAHYAALTTAQLFGMIHLGLSYRF